MTETRTFERKFVTGLALLALMFAALVFVAHPRAQAAPMHGKMMHGKMMPQTAASRRVQAQVNRIKAGPNYKCCIRPMCDSCAVTMGSCPCGKHAAMGMPVCTQCKSGWDAGMGVVPGKTDADIKTMKPMDGMMTHGKMGGMGKM